MPTTRVEHDSLGPVNVPADKLWGAQTQRSLEHFSIGDDLIPREMIPAYAFVKKAAALVNHQAGRLGDTPKDLIVRVCDEVLAGQHQDQFPLHVWMTGSGTQFNMNIKPYIVSSDAVAARHSARGIVAGNGGGGFRSRFTKRTTTRTRMAMPSGRWIDTSMW